MGIPWIQKIKVANYILKQRLHGKKKFPLVLMLEPLFQCNLACAGCGKIDYPVETLKRRVNINKALAAVDECGAPIVSIPGGEPLIHKEMPEIVKGIIQRKKFVYLCTNALLLDKKLSDYTPSNYLTFSIHLDGNEQRHDESVCRKGTFKKVIDVTKKLITQGFRANINCTLFANEHPAEVADFFDMVTELGIEGITVSPGYSYEHAPTQDNFLSRTKSKLLFRSIFKLGQERNSKWPFSHSSLFLDFLSGNQTYHCTPWANPTFNIFGWQKPCYLLVDEGHTDSFEKLINDTDWDNYGVGKNPKCQNCMAHCGFEGTAVLDTFNNPLKALKVWLFGPNLTGPMAPEVPTRPLAPLNTGESSYEN